MPVLPFPCYAPIWCSFCILRLAYVVAISAFFVVAAFGMFIKYDCGNGAQLEAMASEARAQKQAQFAVESRNVYLRQFDEAAASFAK